MKKLLTLILSLSIISCSNDNYKNAEELYNQGIIEKSKHILKKATLSALKVKKDNSQFFEAQLLIKKIDSVNYLWHNYNINQIREIKAESLKKLNEKIKNDSLNDLEIKQLTKERLKLKELKKKENLKSLKKLKKNFDDISGINWYNQPYFTHYTNTNLTSIYMGEKGSSKWLILKMSYKGNDWIFFDKAILSYDGNSKTIPFNEYDDKKTEIGNGDVWEWIDVSITKDLEVFLRKFANSKKAKMRLTGKYTKTRTLTYNERQGILDVLNGYDALNN